MSLLSFEQLQETIPTPMELWEELPLPHSHALRIEEQRATIRRILTGEDSRLLLVVGPCSIHDIESALAYAQRLQELSFAVSDHFYIVMRTYFEKPRTSQGWKGLLFDPHLDGSHDMATGLRLSRRLLLKLAEMGIPAGCEILETHTAHYVTELLAWGCIGARTCTSQPHRQMASAMPFPMGFKNGIDGSVLSAIQGIVSASQPHTFLGTLPSGQVGRIESSGNPDGHIILRGGTQGTNFDANSIAGAKVLCQHHGISKRLLIDCSHDNCEKVPAKQVAAFESVVQQFQSGNHAIGGVMLESHLSAGRQAPLPGACPRISITDPCLDWETTEALIRQSV